MPRLRLTSIVPPLLALLMGWRELDGDRWFTQKSLLSTGYYFDNPGAPYGERIVAGAILATIAVAALFFLWRTRYQILTALREFQPWLRSLVTGVALLGASLALDGIGRKLAPFGIRLSEAGGTMAKAVEEAAELGVAVAFLIALLQLRFDPVRNVLPDR
jgi:hypothetical protein